MERKRYSLIVFILAAMFACPAIAIASGGDEIPRMTKEELKGLLGSPEVVILDVRWEGGSAPERISGSVFQDPDKVASWASNFSKEKKIVLYCS